MTLVDRGDGTELSVHVELPDGIEERISAAWLAHIEHGWRDTVDRIQRAMNSKRLPNGSLA